MLKKLIIPPWLLSESNVKDDLLTSITNEEKQKEQEAKNNVMVICGRCEENMLYKDYEEIHKQKHYNLCWLKDEDEIDFDDEILTQELLKQYLPKYAARDKKIKLICEWCATVKKSLPGFTNHLKKCQSRPDKISLIDGNEDICVVKFYNSDKDSATVKCGRCKKEMTYKEYYNKHMAKHYNLCWIDGEDKPNFDNYEVVLSLLKQYIPFKVVRNRGVKLTCEDCKTVKKSLPGFASHIVFCKKSDIDTRLLLVECEQCKRKVKPTSLASHRTTCSNAIEKKKKNSHSVRLEEGDNLYYRFKRKQRPPNILSFHPGTKYLTEYYDYSCYFCELTSMDFYKLVKHVEVLHNIDITEIKINSKKYITNSYDLFMNVHLKPLLNYYNFFKKKFWHENYYDYLQPRIQLLNNTDAEKYLPGVRKSCKILCSEDSYISVHLFQSIYINDMYWLFTGGPNWSMAWCPVPENVHVQYLAVSCHPNPDLIHKEIGCYKYPSLLQLWIFDSLHNIIHDSKDSMPHMSYGIAHEFGAVWDMAWCPSGAYEQDKKIGLLALSTSCGDCPIFTMPHVISDLEKYTIYKAKPIIARNFEFEENKDGVQCTKVCWQLTSPFTTLICGYSNGLISIFNLKRNSIFLSNEILYPCNTFRASKSIITGLSTNFLNTSILATTAFDGIVNLWDLQLTENPIFETKFYCLSDCSWLQQCYLLILSCKGVNSAFSKMRSINFLNCNDDFHNYNDELFVLTSSDSNNIVVNSDIVNKTVSDTMMDDSFDLDENEKINTTSDADCCEENNEENDYNMNDNDGIDNSNCDLSSEHLNLSDNEVSNTKRKKKKVKEHNQNIEEELILKDQEDEDFYGPSFFQSGIHWSITGSNWMNLIATGDENGNVYENHYSVDTNQIRKKNINIVQVSVKKMSSYCSSQPELLNLSYFKDTIQAFALEAKSYPTDNDIKAHKKDDKSLLRYPLENITKVCWNQNFTSFRWLAIGTQSGFTLITPSKNLSENLLQSFYDAVSTTYDNIS
ncbi:uncharacterized protein LOC126908455 isoform X2 [Daktulosphaira vitifoliae]|uniref:uncharacterized protein LOC126908455 isoform X2 n=1 Tax=Daktulosphaira vitifoliae TaxID=58002 RepID=UPI0021AA3D86|nr:uncharacterized protein LOC126908455 isoform X2 [Daktulosphaira vitifoliae]